MALAREWALYRVEDKDNSYFEDVYYDSLTAIRKAEELFKIHPEFCYEVEERTVIFTIQTK